MSVGPRAVGRGALSLVKHRRAIRRAVRDFHVTEGLKFSGVGVSLVVKLPRRSLSSIQGAVRVLGRLSPSGVAVRSLTVGHTTQLGVFGSHCRDVVVIGARRRVSLYTRCYRGVKLSPCCLCHRGKVTKGVRGIKCTGPNGTKICGILVVRRHRAVITYNTKTSAGQM